MGSPMMDSWGSFYPGMIFGWLFMILFLAAIVLLVVWLYKQIAAPKEPSRSETPSALDILKRRYAKGEIDKKEFEQKKKDLEE